MKELDLRYKTALDNIKVSIQNSEQLAAYLDEEEDEQYKALIAAFEPEMHKIYEGVAAADPLELTSLEEYLLQEEFEGLYLPKVLGYSVLRGRITDDTFKYEKPQDHFKKVLLFISSSSNFDQIRNRVGQSIQIGFALSSDIWITNLIEKIENKKVKAYFKSQKIDDYRLLQYRKTALVKYRKQFLSLNYSSAEFPTSVTALKLDNNALQKFLNYRASKSFDNSSLEPEIIKLVNNTEFYKETEFAEILFIIAKYYSTGKEAIIKKAFNELRSTNADFGEWYFKHLLANSSDASEFSAKAQKSLVACISDEVNDELTRYYQLLGQIHSKGFTNEDTINMVREYYFSNEGLSDENSCLRAEIYNNLANVINNLTVAEYQEYFEINKIFAEYMDIFSNQKFNQQLKYLSLTYVKALKKHYTDKRGKDYQDIKKFVKTTFQDFGFMKEKEIVELFKTRRKKKVE